MSENGLRSVTDVLLAVAAEPSTGRRLHMLVDAARDAVAATYGAIGVPDGEGGFARFVTSGMSEDEIARIGPLPRTHGLLAAMLESPAPERMADIRHDRALPVVAVGASGDDLVSRRADRGRRRDRGRLLSGQQGRRRRVLAG